MSRKQPVEGPQQASAHGQHPGALGAGREHKGRTGVGLRGVRPAHSGPPESGTSPGTAPGLKFRPLSSSCSSPRPEHPTGSQARADERPTRFPLRPQGLNRGHVICCLTSLCLSSLICQTGVLIVPSEGACEVEKPQVLGIPPSYAESRHVEKPTAAMTGFVRMKNGKEVGETDS